MQVLRARMAGWTMQTLSHQVQRNSQSNVKTRILDLHINCITKFPDNNVSETDCLWSHTDRWIRIVFPDLKPTCQPIGRASDEIDFTVCHRTESLVVHDGNRKRGLVSRFQYGQGDSSLNLTLMRWESTFSPKTCSVASQPVSRRSGPCIGSFVLAPTPTTPSPARPYPSTEVPPTAMRRSCEGH